MLVALLGIVVCVHAQNLHDDASEKAVWILADVGSHRRLEKMEIEETTTNTSGKQWTYASGLSGLYGASGGSFTTLDSDGSLQEEYALPIYGMHMQSAWNYEKKKTTVIIRKMVELKHLLTRLRASVIFRDNMVTVFGYILNMPRNPLNAELYYTLFQIYEILRLRRIDTLELLSALKSMSTSTPHQQFEILFRHLEGAVPKYLQSAVAIWTEYLKSGLIDLDAIMRPHDGPLVVDFLAGIPSKVLEQLDYPLVFDKSVIQKTSTRMKNLMGPLIAKTLAALRDGSLEFAESLFALIMVHAPLNSIQPETEETERYVVSYITTTGIKDWENITDFIPDEFYEDPYSLIRHVLRQISRRKDLDDEFRDDVRFLIPFVENLTPTFSNQFYSTNSPVLSKPGLDLNLMLQAITPLEYPSYVVDLRNRLSYYVKMRYIDMEKVVRGFNRFDHVRPIDTLIAVLSRIWHRQANLPEEIRNTVGSLRLYLIFKSMMFTFSPVIRVTFMDPIALLHDFKNPLMPREAISVVDKLYSYLRNIDIDWEPIIRETESEECSHPRQCCLYVLKKLALDGRILDEENTYLVKKLLKMFTPDGVPVIHKTHHSDLESTAIALYPNLNNPSTFKDLQPLDFNYGTQSSILSDALDIEDESDQLYPYQSSKSALWGNSFGAPTTNEISSIAWWLKPGIGLDILNWPDIIEQKYVDTPLPRHNPLFDEEIGFLDRPELLLPPTIPDSQQDRKIRPLRYLLMHPDLHTLYDDNITTVDYTTKGQLLRYILQCAVDSPLIQSNPTLLNTTQEYLINVGLKVDNAVVKINLASLINALPLPQNEFERDLYTSIVEYFNTPINPAKLDTLPPRTMLSSGPLLKYILQLSLGLPEVQQDEELRKACSYYSDKVLTDGYGAQGVELSLYWKSRTFHTTGVDLEKIFECLDFNILDKEGWDARNKLFNFLNKKFIPSVHFAGFSFWSFKTRGEFFRAALQHLVIQNSVPEDIRESIMFLLPFVQLTGPGSLPLEFY